MSTRSKFGAGLLIAAIALLVLEGLLRVALGPPTPELAATMPVPSVHKNVASQNCARCIRPP